MKKGIMKVLSVLFSLIFLVGFFSCSVAQDARKFGEIKYTNYLMGTTWKTNGVPFENRDQESYSLTAKGDGNSIMDQWGHSIYFDTLTFSSSYSAPCGNDCFTSVHGTYLFTAENRIRVKIKSIDRHGFCDKKSEVINQDYGFYDLVKVESGYQLKKVK
jgi:hypothetical protein